MTICINCGNDYNQEQQIAMLKIISKKASKKAKDAFKGIMPDEVSEQLNEEHEQEFIKAHKDLCPPCATETFEKYRLPEGFGDLALNTAKALNECDPSEPVPDFLLDAMKYITKTVDVNHPILGPSTANALESINVIEQGQTKVVNLDDTDVWDICIERAMRSIQEDGFKIEKGEMLLITIEEEIVSLVPPKFKIYFNKNSHFTLEVGQIEAWREHVKAIIPEEEFKPYGKLLDSIGDDRLIVVIQLHDKDKEEGIGPVGTKNFARSDFPEEVVVQ